MEHKKSEPESITRVAERCETWLRQLFPDRVIVTTHKHRPSLVVVAGVELRDDLIRLLPIRGFNDYPVERVFLKNHVLLA